MTPPLVPLNLPEPGDTINGKYRILERVGKGGFGVVFRAMHDEMRREVAIKMMRPSIHTNAAHIERFQREVFYTAQLKHPNTITLYDCGRSEHGLLYIVMEFLQGQDLETLLSTSPPFSHQGALEILLQLLGSLAEAHAQGILHRDLKPENLFLVRDPSGALAKVKVLDFGLSKAIRGPNPTHTITQQGQVFGTPHYMSPEQACALPLTPASDIYAVGLIAWELLTGQTAFGGPNPIDIMLKQVNNPLPPLPLALQDTPLAKFIKRATLKRPEDRFQNAFEALQWLERLRAAPSTHAIPLPAQLAESAAVPEPSWLHFRTPGRLEEGELELRLAQLPMIGRQQELERLLAWGNQALMVGGVLWVVGEMGLGKSRLIEEWTRHMELRAVLRLTGTLTPEQDPLVTLGQTLGLLLQEDSPIHDDLPLLFSPLQLRKLHQLLFPGPPPPTLPEAFGLLERFLYTIARHRPTILVLENLHDADDTVLQFVAHLQERISTLAIPLLLVLSTLPAPGPKLQALWHKAPHPPLAQPLSFLFTLHLERLQDADTRLILDELLPFETQVRDRMVQAARGNPRYLCDIVVHLFDSGHLVFDDPSQRWVASPDHPPTHLLPPRLESLLLKRLFHHLHAHPLKGILLALLDRLALLGPRVELRLLRTLLRHEARQDLEQHLDDALEALHQADAVLSTVFERRPSLLFSHDILRTQLLKDLASHPEAPALHRLSARTKITHHGARDQAQLDAHAEEIAQHWEAAGDPAQAFSWLMRAAKASRVAQNFPRALAQSKRARGLLERHELDPDGELRLGIWLLQGEIGRGLGQFDMAQGALREALEETRRVGDTVGEAMTGEQLADVLSLTMKYDEATLLYKEMRERYATFGLPQGTLRCDIGLARLRRWRGEYQEAATTFEALGARAQALGAPLSLVHALHGQAQCAYARGQLHDALELLRRARKRAELLGEAGLYSQIDLDIALALLSTGQVAQSITAAQATLDFKRTLGDELGQANSHLILGLGLRRTYRIAQARQCAAQAQALFEQVNHAYGLAKTTLLQAEIALDTGKLSQAATLLAQSHDQHDVLQDQHGLVVTLIRQTHLALELEHFERAQILLDDLCHKVATYGLTLYLPLIKLHQGTLHQAYGRLHLARQCFLDGLALAEAQHHMEAQGYLLLSLAQCSVLLGQGEEARAYANKALEVAEHIGQGDHLIFALSVQVLLAHLAKTPELMASTLRRLRVLYESRGDYDVDVPGRAEVVRQKDPRAAAPTAGSPHASWPP